MGNSSNPLQILPGCRPHTINHLIVTKTDSLLTLSFTVTGSLSSMHTRFSSFLLPFICVPFFFPLNFSLPKLAVLPPLLLLSPSLSARLHIKADDWFLTVQQAVFYLALCEETKIISMNMEKPASMVISSPVISISVKLTWLNLTYI